MVEKHQLFHSITYPLLEKEAEGTYLNEVRGRVAENTDLSKVKEKATENTGHASGREHEKIGIISSGFTSSTVEEILKKQIKPHAEDSCPEISHLSLTLVNPLPLRKLRLS